MEAVPAGEAPTGWRQGVRFPLPEEGLAKGAPQEQGKLYEGARTGKAKVDEEAARLAFSEKAVEQLRRILRDHLAWEIPVKTAGGGHLPELSHAEHTGKAGMSAAFREFEWAFRRRVVVVELFVGERGGVLPTHVGMVRGS